MSQLFDLTKGDFVRSAVTTVFAAVIVALAGIVTQPNFDLFSADWAGILKSVLNVTVATFVADIGRRFMSDESGKIQTPFGKLG